MTIPAPDAPPANRPAGALRGAGGDHGGARSQGLTPTPAGPGGAPARAEIDDALRVAFLHTVAQDIVADVRVAECRTVLEGQWCAVALEVRQLRFPPFHVARADVDGAVRGAASAIMRVRAVLRERLSFSS